jgi:hypothetical protein
MGLIMFDIHSGLSGSFDLTDCYLGETIHSAPHVDIGPLWVGLLATLFFLGWSRSDLIVELIHDQLQILNPRIIQIRWQHLESLLITGSHGVEVVHLVVLLSLRLHHPWETRVMLVHIVKHLVRIPWSP